MLGTESNGMTLCIMLSIIADKTKRELEHESDERKMSTISRMTMYAFYDAIHRTVLAVSQVLDAKRSPNEAYERLMDYATRLEAELEGLDEEPDGVQSVD